MKEIYNTPIITIEKLTKADVLLASPAIEENSYVASSLFKSIYDDVVRVEEGIRSWWN